MILAWHGLTRHSQKPEVPYDNSDDCDATKATETEKKKEEWHKEVTQHPLNATGW